MPGTSFAITERTYSPEAILYGDAGGWNITVSANQFHDLTEDQSVTLTIVSEHVYQFERPRRNLSRVA